MIGRSAQGRGSGKYWWESLLAVKQTPKIFMVIFRFQILIEALLMSFPPLLNSILKKRERQKERKSKGGRNIIYKTMVCQYPPISHLKWFFGHFIRYKLASFVLIKRIMSAFMNSCPHVVLEIPQLCPIVNRGNYILWIW